MGLQSQSKVTMPETECTCISANGISASCQDHWQDGSDPWCYVSEKAQCDPGKDWSISGSYWIDCARVEAAKFLAVPLVCSNSPAFLDAFSFSCSSWTGHSCASAFGYSSRQLEDVRENCPHACNICGEAQLEARGMEKVVVLIEMSMLVYGLTTSELSVRQVSARSGIINLAGYLSDDITCYQQSGSFLLRTYTPGICIWVKKHPKRAVIAVRGTDPSHNSGADLIFDIRHIFGGRSPDAAKNFLTQKVADYRQQGYEVLITGHSLGGYLAEIASSYLYVPGMGFDAPGTLGDDRFQKWSVAESSPSVRHTGWNGNRHFHILNAEPLYFSSDYLLGNLGWPYFSHYTPPIWLKGLNGAGLEAHKLERLMEVFKALPNYEAITNANIMDYVKPCGPEFHHQASCTGGVSCGMASFWLPAAPSVPQCPV